MIAWRRVPPIVLALTLGTVTGCGDDDATSIEHEPSADIATAAPSGASPETSARSDERDGVDIVNGFSSTFLDGALGIEEDYHDGGDQSALGVDADPWVEEFNSGGSAYYRPPEKLREDDQRATFTEQFGVDGSAMRDGSWYAGVMADPASAASLVGRLDGVGTRSSDGSGVTYLDCGSECADMGNVGAAFVWAEGPVVFIVELEWDDDDGNPLSDGDIQTIADALKSASGSS